MAGSPQTAIPINVRLPAWASEFVERRASETGATKTQVLVDAIACLRAAHVQALMREGYEEMRQANRQMAEEDLAAADGSLPEW